MNKNVKKLALTAIFAALAVVGSLFSFPVAGAKCAPIQHFVNIMCAVFVGPWWGLGCAFVASLIRLLTGLGSPLAFPGSMCGALLAGLLYKFFKKLPFAYLGELIGTSLIGGFLAYPIAIMFMDKPSTMAATVFIFPFFVSCAGGTIIAIVLTMALKASGMLKKMQDTLNN